MTDENIFSKALWAPVKTMDIKSPSHSSRLFHATLPLQGRSETLIFSNNKQPLTKQPLPPAPPTHSDNLSPASLLPWLLKPSTLLRYYSLPTLLSLGRKWEGGGPLCFIICYVHA